MSVCLVGWLAVCLSVCLLFCLTGFLSVCLCLLGGVYVPWYFSDLKPRLNNYVFALWQRQWDEYPGNKLHKILPKLADRLPSRCFTRREETALSRLHIGHSHVTHLFLLKGEEPPSCVSCDEPHSLQHILISCSDLIDMTHYQTKVLQCKFAEGVVRRVSLDIIFKFLKDINVFYKL